MKKHYLLFLVASLLIVSDVVGQSQSGLPDVPESPAHRVRKTHAPFLGVSVNIPLWKVFGRKKVKPLPEAPKPDTTSFYEAEWAISDSEPIQTGFGDGGIITPITPALPNIPEGTPTRWDDECGCEVIDTDVTVRPDPTDSAPPGPGDVPPPMDRGGDNGGGGGGGSSGSSGSGANSGDDTGESPEQKQERECRECKEAARSEIALARLKRELAFETYVSKKSEIEGRFVGDFFESWAVGIGFAAVVIEGGAVFVSTPVGAISVSAAAVLLGGVSAASTFVARMNAAESEAGNAYREMQIANAEWEFALQKFESTLRGCGTCP